MMQTSFLTFVSQSLLFIILSMLSVFLGEPPTSETPGSHKTTGKEAPTPSSDTVAKRITIDDAREQVKKSTLKMGLRLDSITEIDPEVATVLSKTQGVLALNGLRTIDTESAQALTSKGNLSIELNGLVEISPQVASALARTSYLQLNALRPGPEVIRELGNRSGALQLNALAALDIESANHLTKERYPLSLDGVESISSEVAKALSTSQAFLSMQGIEELSADAQEEFSMHTGGLSLRSLRSLRNTKLAENLAGQRLGVELPKLEDVSIDCLSILATSKTRVSLGLSELTLEQARALSQCNSRLSLTRIRRLDKEQIDILLNSPARIELWGLSELLDARLAERLANDASKMLRVDLVESLSGEAAAAITRGKHILTLYNLRILEPAVAKALATHRGHIILSGLKEMSDDHADLFAAREGSLYLSREMVISDYARQRLESNKRITWRKQSATRRGE